jgi:hypothetical protein
VDSSNDVRRALPRLGPSSLKWPYLAEILD